MTIVGFTCVTGILLRFVLNETMTLEDQNFSTYFINTLNSYYTDAQAIFKDDSILNVVLALCLTLFAKNVGGWRLFRSVCLMIVTLVAGHHLYPSLKVGFITFVTF